MTITVPDVMREVSNAFPKARWEGAFTLTGGRLNLDALLPGDWIAVEGSLRFDGIHQLDAEGRLPGAADEGFTGAVWLLSPPADFLRLCGEIAAWAETAAQPGVKRESFGAYAVEYPTNALGLTPDWRGAFAAQLRPWRRMAEEVPLC